MVNVGRRKHYRRNKIRLKLKKGTVYSIFSFGLIVSGILLLLSFTRSQEAFVAINNYLNQSFGILSFFAPFVFIFLGFLFLRLKFILSRLNISVGFLLFFICLSGLLKAGSIGVGLFAYLSDILSGFGANIVYLAGVVIGLIVFFDTSIDEIMGFAMLFFRNTYRLLPTGLLAFFKTKISPDFKDKKMTIRGSGVGTKDVPNLSAREIAVKTAVVKKESPILSDRLVSNPLNASGIWEYPPYSLLSDVGNQKADRGDIKKVASVIENTLQSFGIGAKVVEVNLGPAVTQYALEIALGTKVSKITSLTNDLALATEAPTGQIRIEAPIPGRNLVGIEIPSRTLEIVTLKIMLESSVMNKNKSKLTVSLGLDVSGNPVVADIAKMPHVLIAGTTGSGKSVLINSFISSLLFKNAYRLFPRELLAFFKTKKDVDFKDKKMTIRGSGIGTKDVPNLSARDITVKTTVIKKEPPILSDKLVSNPLNASGIWQYPPYSLLSDVGNQKADRGDIKKVASVIEKTLQSFGIGAKVVEVNLGPAVTQYALEIALGTKVSKITSLSNDLALATEAPTGQIRIEAPIPGRNLVGIEIPNRTLEIVTLKTMLESSIMNKSKSKITVSLGLDVSGNPIVADLAKMPHVLIAGTTGSGKSVLINSFIASLLFRSSPSELKLILIDPKRVELIGYNGIPHLMTPVIVEVEKILASLKWAMDEMERRYKTFAERGVRNIDSYNELAGFQSLPYIIILIDELADLMAFAPVEVEDAIARLAQMARATGIHLVVSTQRPSVDVLTGLIKANIPCRIAFNVSSMVDSRVIIDTPGAEKLLGRGDMLYIPPDQAKPTRIQGAFVSEKEVKRLVDFLKARSPSVEYTEEITSRPLITKKIGGISPNGKDTLFEEAIRIVCQYDRASASLLQRRLSIGYSRAARILDQLEEQGVVGHAEGSKPRDVLAKNADEVINNLNHG